MNSGRFARFVKFVLFLGDVLFLNILFLALYFRGHLIIHPIDRSWFVFLGLINLSWLIVLFGTNPYKVFRVTKAGNLARDIAFAIFQQFLITSTVLYLMAFPQVHWWSVAAVYSIFLLVELAWRLIFLYYLRWNRLRGKNIQRVAVLGYGPLAIQLQRFFSRHPEFGYRISGFFDDNHRSEKISGDLEGFFEHVSQEGIEEVYCCAPYLPYDQVREVIDWCEDKFIKVKVLNEYRALSLKSVELERYDNIPILSVTALPLDDKRNQLLKRLFDLTFASLFMVMVGWWLFLLLALIIRLDSRGPVFFRQLRAGRNNTAFKCWKFRTMRVNDEADSLQATRNDPRVTRVGGFLRKTSLDELPQFLNVLQGNMSVVGPRPHPLLLNENFARRIGKFMARHSVKPGITGLAQVKGYRGETRELHDMRGRFRLDVFYIENWSFPLDVKIILQTIGQMFKGSGKAY
ncbi:MAG: undecaprenyl-phosphate glucose phosphotransferase [Cyclobacteriaceae bacterium]